MEFHPLANLFPLLSPPELDELAADIAAHGQIEPIYVYQGKILDGRNRYLACVLAKVEPRLVEWQGEDPLAFVVSKNLHRRHLDESQRAVVAGKLASLKKGRPANDSSTNGAQDVAGGGENVQICTFDLAGSLGLARRQAAELLNVSPRLVSHARTVLEHADDAVALAVVDGVVSVSDAAKVARRPREVQRAALEAVKQGKAKTLAEAAAEGAAPRAPRRPRVPGAASAGRLHPEPEHRPRGARNTPADWDVSIDSLGKVIPDEYRAVFASRREFAAVAQMLDEVERAVESLAHSPGGFYLLQSWNAATERFRQLKCLIARAEPYSVELGRQAEPKWVSQMEWSGLSDDQHGDG